MNSEFEKLAEEYEKGAGYHSFPHMMRKCPAYEKLIAIGKPIVPLILHKMNSGLEHFGGVMWFIVLEAVTGENPLPPEPLMTFEGNPIPNWVGINVEDTQKAWIKWGKAKGLL